MADLLSYALTTVADVKESLGLDSGDTSKDNLIKRKINLATEYIEGYCGLSYGHHLAQTTYTDELFDGNGIDQLKLRARPVTAVTSFSYRNAYDNVDNWDAFDTEDYFINNNAGIIDGVAIRNTRYDSYKVTYTAGYSPIPADLAEACAVLATHLVENPDTQAITRKKEGAREVQYAVASTELTLIQQLGLDDILNRYRMY